VTTSEPLAVADRFFEVVSSRDSAAISELVDPEGVWYGTRGGLDQDRVVRGPAQWLEYISEIQDTWEGFEVEVERAIEVGDRVVAYTRESARTRDGALEVQSETAVVMRIREGRIVEARGYLDRDEALRAARATN
jgi:ketosteroid isomerase-like protein